ncbi:MAG: glycyl-radical enzyme activating protein [candidate division Zixibacteria bacterium]|nr:glycyl-radical enzyme activating protein [candidate division Zixibacteria bacterium]
MNGTIFDIKKFAIHDGPGIRTTVFFKGCPLDCWWCHNPECRETTDNQAAVPGREVSVSEVMTEIEKDTVFYEQSGGGVTFSGGEPLAQMDFLKTLLGACRQKEIHTALDTCGFAPWEEFEKILGLVDLFLYDLKIMDDTQHRKYTGQPNALILENLQRLSREDVRINLRVPLVPGITDSDDNLDAIAGFVSNLPGISHVSLLPYNKLGEDKLRRFRRVNRLGGLRTFAESEVADKAARFTALGYAVKIGG